MNHCSITQKMALQSITLSPQSIRSPPSLPCAGKHQIVLSPSSSFSSNSLCSKFNGTIRSKKRDWAFRVRSSLDTVEPTVGQVTEVNKDTFWPIVKAAGDKTVVLDMYTQWYPSIHIHTSSMVIAVHSFIHVRVQCYVFV